MTRNKTQICILGGGFGGLYTALYLSKFSWSHKCQIILVEQKDRFLFTPLLYELLTGELQPWEIAPSYQKLLHKSNIKFCQDTIAEVDLKTQKVNLESGDRLNYDYLVLAVGTKGRVANIPGAARYALNFRSLADVESLQARLDLLERSGRVKLRVAIIGGGPNGVELACKLADRLQQRSQIHLIDRGSEILKDFSPGVRSASSRALKKRSIKLDLETSVAEITADSICLIHNNNSVTVPVDLVLWTAGVESRELLRDLSCPQDERGKILTRATLQVIDYPEVFALGDVAKIHNNTQSIPATAQAAYQQASRISKNIQAAIKGKTLKPFRYLHLGDMLTLGANAAVVGSFFLLLEGRLAAIMRKLIYIQRLPTNRHRLQVLKNAFIRSIESIFARKSISKKVKQKSKQIL